MIEVIDVWEPVTLDDYAAYTRLTHAAQDLRRAAEATDARLEDRTVWMVNSTAQGGGVAEMLPKVVSLMREVGVQTEWAVIHPKEQRFFDLTKRIHNLLHGSGDPHLTADDRALYESVSQELAEAFRRRIGPDDLLVIHDPQPLGMGALLKASTGVPALWRCHVGLDRQTPATRAVWSFLRPWAERYDRAVFSLPEYAPGFLRARAAIIPPGIDPLSHKNRELPTHKFTGILQNAALVPSLLPVLTPPFTTPALRLQRDGSFAPATQPQDLGLLFQPTVTQVSRWDVLKGFAPLLRGFAFLKRHRAAFAREGSGLHRRRLDLVRLVLAGPDPSAVQDDPEGQATFADLSRQWRALGAGVQQDIAILTLPMQSRKVNALMVNALQRCSTIVVQNSLREGFGLTATEAMWKALPVLGTQAAGLRAQIEDGVHGRLLEDARDPEEIARTLNEMLGSKRKEVWARNGQRRVAEQFLVLSQVKRWVQVLDDLGQHAPPAPA